MAKGNLELGITDMAGEAIGARLEFALEPFSGDAGTGGQSMDGQVGMGAATELKITGIRCRGGVGTMYEVTARTANHRPYTFFQMIREGVDNESADDVAFWVDPGAVTGIRGPSFSDLPVAAQRMLTGAQMTVDKPEDVDLAGRTGADLYDGMGALRQACLLNLVKKAAHPTAASCLGMIGPLLICRQDRFFALVDEGLPARLTSSPAFRSARGDLHEPLAGFAMTGQSFKSQDAHANIQMTFQRRTDGTLAADIDIDESTGIGHGLEVIRNGVFRRRTNPYLIREFMLAADPLEHTLDPGYRFRF